MGGDDEAREPFIIDAEEFIGVKTFKAKGKRVTNWQVDSITEVEPREPDTPDAPDEPDGDDAPGGDSQEPQGISQEEVLDQLTGQQRLPFDDV